jgi:hypothetical protein
VVLAIPDNSPVPLKRLIILLRFFNDLLQTCVILTLWLLKAGDAKYVPIKWTLIQ